MGQDGDGVVIRDAPFDMSYMRFDESQYESTLQIKLERIRAMLHEHAPRVPQRAGLFDSDVDAQLETFRSQVREFRMKCRFGVQHDGPGGDMRYYQP